MGERLELSLREGLASVPDPRHPPGRRHPLAGILALAVCAMLGDGAAGMPSPRGGPGASGVDPSLGLYPGAAPWRRYLALYFPAAGWSRLCGRPDPGGQGRLHRISGPSWSGTAKPCGGCRGPN